MCDTLENSPKDGTLAHLIERNGLERVMEMPYMKLPWLLPAGNYDARVGYSDWLKQLVMSLLRPVVNDRFLPSQLVDPLRSEQSPLLQPNVVAANSTTAGASVTIDNVQLGMLVQRGRDWDDGDADGGAGCIGVITKLDHDALFTWVTFPLTLDSVCCRIGSNCKYELQVSAEISDYLTGTKNCIRNGIAVAHEQKAPGHMLNSNCMVIGNDISRGILFAAPLQRTLIPSLPSPGVWRTDKNVFASPIEDVSHPDSWNFNLGALAKVEQDEWDMVLSLFYGDDKPGKQLCETYQPVDRVQRVQNSWLWESYARRKGFIALENWGVHNELRVFVVCNEKLSADNLQNFQSSGKEFSTTASIMHDRFNNTLISGSQLQMILCRVVLGRVFEVNSNSSGQTQSMPEEKCHSKLISHDHFACRGTCQIYPEYIITYRDKSGSSQRTVPRADVSQPSPSTGSNVSPTRSPTKLCIICMEEPVKFVMIVSTLILCSQLFYLGSVLIFCYFLFNGAAMRSHLPLRILQRSFKPTEVEKEMP